MNTTSIELENISKSYKGPKKTTITAVESLTLSIGGSQVFGILGANGAGKTTTIKMICGLVNPTTGTIRLNGYDVKRQRSQAARQIGAVLEGTRNVYWRLSPWQNLRYFGHLKGYRGKELKIRAEQLLRELDLWERRNDPIRMFSRGMQQKVAIACALISDPPIILLDEPTLGLDIQAAHTVKEWINLLARERGKTVVLTTHQLDMAQELCDYVAIMRKGQLLTHLPLEDLLHHFHQERYQIRIKGLIPEGQKGQFASLKIEVDGGETTLDGTLTSQEQLQHFLGLLHALQLPLLSVERCEPDLEEVFLHLMEERQLMTENQMLMRR